MKKPLSILGFLLLVLVIGFTIAACSNSTNDTPPPNSGKPSLSEFKAETLKMYQDDPASFGFMVALVNSMLGLSLGNDPTKWSDADWNALYSRYDEFEKMFDERGAGVMGG